MARKTKTAAPRTLTCQRTGRTFEYKGFGRPPKYHPDVAETVRKEQRAKSAANRKAATASAKLAKAA